MQANIKRVHIISRYNGGWAVKKQGAARALKVFPTKEEAVIGSSPYLQLGYDLVIHRKDGSVELYKKAADTSFAGFSMEEFEKKVVEKPRQGTSATSKGAKKK
jgi:hypothetical protein